LPVLITNAAAGRCALEENTYSLFTCPKQKWLFRRAGLFPANQSNLKSFQKALIGWKEAGPSKKPLLFWTCKQAVNVILGSSSLPVVVASHTKDMETEQFSLE